MRPSQAYQPLLAIVLPVIIPGEHWVIKSFHAAGQVNLVPAQVLPAFGRIVIHALFSVYALILPGKLGEKARAKYSQLYLVIIT